MKKIFAIAEKELKGYFKSPIAYITLIILITVFNLFFYIIIDQNREATLRDVFLIMEFMFIFVIPILTMKSFSEEKQAGTMEFLMTTPTKNSEIVLGKYLGVLLFFSLMMVLTLVYYLIIEIFAQPDRAAIFTGYFGVWLEGAFFIAIGLLVSSWTRNQIVAAMVTYAIVFLLYFSLSFVQYFDGGTKALIEYISTLTHSQNFIVGIISLADVVYYLSGILLCVTLTRLSIENRLWR